jgi:hypothetical protein
MFEEIYFFLLDIFKNKLFKNLKKNVVKMKRYK